MPPIYISLHWFKTLVFSTFFHFYSLYQFALV